MLQKIWFLMMVGGFVTFFVIFGYYVITKTPVDPWVLSSAVIVSGIGFVFHERMNLIEIILVVIGLILITAPVSLVELIDSDLERSSQIVFIVPILGFFIILFGWYLNRMRLSPAENKDIT